MGKDQVAVLLREAQQRAREAGKAPCHYGVHEFVRDQPFSGMKECARCGAVYMTYERPCSAAEGCWGVATP